jgi:uncharacterized protein (TIGR00251 family)
MIIGVVVKPGSREFRAEWRAGALHVALTEQAEKNKANIELLKELKRIFGCEVRLVSGATSKRKRIEISISEAELQSKMQTHK